MFVKLLYRTSQFTFYHKTTTTYDNNHSNLFYLVCNFSRMKENSDMLHHVSFVFLPSTNHHESGNG